MKQIPNSKYYVDADGNVYGPRKNKLKLQKTSKGYLTVKVSVNRKITRKPAHRLVAMTFIPNPEDKPMVNHINGDKGDNRVVNLEWVTAKENSQHAKNVLGQGFGETHSQAVLTEEIVREICERLQDRQRNKDIAEALGVPRYTVKSIRIGASWRHISEEYEICNSRQKNVSDATVRWVCKCLQEGMSTKEILEKSRSTPMSKSLIYKIKSGRVRKHITEQFKF